MAEPKQALSYRWVIEVLLFAAFLGQSLTWLAPAPLLKPIMEDLRIELGSAGLIISIIALCIAFFSLVGALVARRLGALRAFIVGLWLLAIGAVLSGYSQNFAMLLVCRVIEGIGFGVMISPPGTLVMEWFPEREWPWINMVNALVAYIGLTTVYALTPQIYFALNSSWRGVLRSYGFGVMAVALLWSILGRERDVRLPQAEGAAGSALGEVIRMRNVVLIGVGLFGGMWVFQLYTAFLPQFFQTERGLGMSEAASLTAILPLTGILAAAGGGFATGLTGLRKPFTWPIAILTLIGCIGAVVLPSTAGIRLSLVLVGIGAAGSLAAITTLLMELPGMTPARLGSGLAFIWAVGYAGAFISPFLGGALATSMGLRNVLLAMVSVQILPIAAMYAIPETGPGRGRSIPKPIGAAIDEVAPVSNRLAD